MTRTPVGSQSRSEIAAAIIEAAQQLHSKNFLAANDGNISLRINNDHVLITPSGVPKWKLKAEDFALVDLKGNVLEAKPSSELSMHLKVYQTCPKAKCVVHAHPPVSIAWSIAKPHLKFLPDECISELILATGRIPVVPYARPGTSEMAEVLEGIVEDYRVMILARHGALSWGESVEEAYNGIERLEHAALILKEAETLGGLTNLPKSEVKHLREKRRELGERTL
jgi:L-fuculose-phosphate aldolase